MDRRIIKKVADFQVGFKQDIQKWIKDNHITIGNGKEDKTEEFLQYIFDHDKLTLTVEDFQKRRRVKTVVPHNEKCLAKRADGMRCTRRKRDGCTFCGTHNKGTPHGIFETEKESNIIPDKLEVWVEDINGIQYYIDANHNVYKHEDIMARSTNPKIIAKWEMKNGKYEIVEN